jgi:superfamily I DNA/RNA helicase
VYDDVEDLVESVGRYVDAGLRAEEPAILVATAAHSQRFEQDLEQRGWDVTELRRARRLTLFDADETLAAFMDDELPSAARFEQVVGGLVDEVAQNFPDRTIRAFGEMVDLLWRRGRESAAIALEELWNELAESRRFALLCGYHLDIFDIDVQRDALPPVFHVHSHVRPAAEPSRLAAAVDQALSEILGAHEAARVYLDAAQHSETRGVPRSQAVLMWLSSERPPRAEAILQRVRSHYRRLREAPLTASA